MLKWTRTWLPSLLAAMLLSSITVSTTSLTAHAADETVQQVKQELTYEQSRKAIQDALESYKKEPAKESLMGVIDTFLKLPTLEDYPKVEYVNDKQDFADLILSEIGKMPNDADQVELKTYFATQAVDLISNSKSFNDYAVAHSLIKLLPESQERTDLVAKLEKAKNELPKITDEYIDWNNPPKDINDYLDPIPTPKYDNFPPEFNKEAYEKAINTTPVPSLSEYDRTEMNYRKINGKCYKVTDYYKGGKIAKTEKTVPDQTELLFCGVISDSTASNSSTSFPGGGSTIGAGNTPTRGVFKGFDPYSETARSKIQKEEQAEKAAKPELITIQYTFDKTSESPYYYDTGISIPNNKTVTYAQAKDALLMISIQAKGKFVEDKDKSIALIDGKIIRVAEHGKALSFDEFTASFDQTSVSVRALDTRSGEQVEIADLVEIKGVHSVVIKNKEVQLGSNAIVDNSIVLFPIEQIAKELGSSVNKTSDKMTIVNGKNTFHYEVGSTTVLMNDKKIDLQVPVRINKNGIWMAPIRSFVDRLGLTLEVSDSRVVIK
ncbi:stalk domain-containing protein [Paenibacillus polymyxa]|uniref:Copper amine oxidase-like N-terminal domain-containing protein n=1 Tax=Paenibacillus polymyxa (strain SC2) TaxID=886882 RepID=E3EKP7_PAEPS|nr:stalk domain-containing protein [Paenibacillus polymyxa]ADO59498.1 hypothetical protein PPSC2_27595 [Paenibacillus polymyxa SC2]WPQ59666.1 stalk domain-containing protein [Paenibacillus polymyxa]